MLKFTWSFTKKYRGSLILLAGAILISALSRFLVPGILGKYIDSFNKAENIGIYLVYSFLILAILETTSGFFNSYIRNKISNRITLDMIKDLTNYILKLPLSYLRKNDILYLGNRINMDSFTLSYFFMQLFSEVTVNIVSFVVVFIYIFSIDIGIGIKLLLLIPLYMLVYRLFRKPLYDTMMESKEKINLAMGLMNNQLLNYKLAKINSWFDVFYNNMTISTDEAQKKAEKSMGVEFSFNSIDNVIKRIANLILIIYSGNLVLKGRLTAGQFTIINAYFTIALESINMIINFGKSYADCMVSFNRVKELLDIGSELNGSEKINNIDKIELKDIHFSYNDESDIIKDFSYSFNRGKLYCLCGKNGIGKSTLTNIILGIIQEFNGQVFYNNKNMFDLDMYDVRKNLISYVEQEPILLDGTLKENLTLGMERVDYEIFDYWTNRLNIESIMEKGYDDVINSSSINLSGGEKQRIAIARSLIKNGDVLIMDEPTSALDLKSKDQFKEIINKIKMDKIIILITHDEDIKNMADEIIDLNIAVNKELIIENN